MEEHALKEDDFLLSRSGAYAGMVRIFSPAKEDLKAYIPAAFLIRFRLDQERLLPSYLREFCESEFGKKALTNLTQGSAQPNISGSDFMSMSLPVPGIETQKAFLEEMHQFRKAEIDARERLTNSRSVLRRATESIFDRSG